MLARRKLFKLEPPTSGRNLGYDATYVKEYIITESPYGVIWGEENTEMQWVISEMPSDREDEKN